MYFFYAFLNFITSKNSYFGKKCNLFIYCNLSLHMPPEHIINLSEWNNSRQQHETQPTHSVLLDCLRRIHGCCFAPEDHERSGVCEGKISFHRFNPETLILLSLCPFSQQRCTYIMLILNNSPLQIHIAWLGIMIPWFLVLTVSICINIGAVKVTLKAAVLYEKNTKSHVLLVYSAPV